MIFSPKTYKKNLNLTHFNINTLYYKGENVWQNFNT